MRTSRWIAMGVACALALPGCAGAPAQPGEAAFVVDRQALIARLASPQASDWSSGRLASREIDEARAALAASPQRRLQAVGTVPLKLAATAFPGVGTGASAPNRITSAPAYHYMPKRAYWITENGWLLPVDMSGASPVAGSAVRVSTTHTFGGTAVTLSNDGRRAYLCSREGGFFAVDLASGQLIPVRNASGVNFGAFYAMGGTSPAVQAENAVPPPFIDALASRADGQAETVYALTQRGTLHRFTVEAIAGQAPIVTWAQGYTLPTGDTVSPYEELFRAGPVIIRGKLVVGSWRRHTTATSRVLDTGRLFFYDTGCTSPIKGLTSGTATTQRHSFSYPVWASASVEFDNGLNPVYAFVPTGFVVSMVDLTGSMKRAESPPLLVNTITPVASSLAAYTAATSTGIATATVPAAPDGWVSVADSSTFTRYPESAPTTFKDTGALFAAKLYGTYSTATGTATDNTPSFGYLKFRLASSDLVVTDGFGNTSVRSVIGARVRLTVSRPSNQGTGNNNAGYDPTIAPLRVFEVSNQLTTGTAWSGFNMTPTARPRFPNETTPFTLANLNARAADELPAFGPANLFQLNYAYEWDAKGRVGTADQDYSFGLAHPQLSYLNTASNNGVPHQMGAPQFYTQSGTASQNPQLVLTLSAEGLATPTMSTPVAIDSLNQRIYALNCNALWVMSYASPTHGLNFNAASFAERAASLGSPASTHFALTRIGQVSTSAGPTATVGTAKQYVPNLTAPLLAPTGVGNQLKVYVMDNHPTFQQTAINLFANHPPTLSEYNQLTSLHADAKRGGTYLAYDYTNTRVYASTCDPTATTGTIGRAWVISQ